MSVDQSPREQGDGADVSDPESDRRRPRESLGEERETKRVRINVFDDEESDEMGGDRRRMGANRPSSTTRTVLFPTTLRADLS